MKVYKIEKRFLDKILSGEKKVEFRKELSACVQGGREIHFESSGEIRPKERVTFLVKRVLCIKKNEITKLYPKTTEGELCFLDSYLAGGKYVWAIELGDRIK